MRWWVRFQALLPRILRRTQAERDLEDEIQFDLAEETRLRVERGESPEAARTAVRREFGRLAAVKEDTRAVWGWTLLERVVQDLRFAVRTLARSPGFTAAAAVTLGLGIGLCCFLFSTLNGMMLRPLPGVPQAQRLVAVEAAVSYPEFEQYRDAATITTSGSHNASGVASAAAAFLGPVPFGVALEGAADARPERIFGHLVSPEYFSTLGVEPFLGRFFDPIEQRRGAAPAVVVSERFWRTRLNADPRAAGSALRINGQPATIVGVAQKDFLGVFPVRPADIFVPVTADAAVAPELAGDVLGRATSPAFRVVLRLAPGVTMAAAEAALEVQARAFAEQQARDANQDRQGRLVRLVVAGGSVPWLSEQRSMIVVFFGLLIGLVLSFTCANLAGLILARGSARGNEIAIRLSLGASRLQLVRQLLTESILLATVGGAAGLAAAYGLLKLLMESLGGATPFSSALTLTPDLRAALLTFLVAALAGGGFGLLPALATTRPDLVTALKGTSTTVLSRYRRFGLRNLFMVYQMGSAMALVLIMGFMAGRLQQASHQNPGFDPEGLYLFSLDPLRDGYSPNETAALLRDMPERLERLAGVDAATLADQTLSRLFALPDTSVSVPAPAEGNRESIHRVMLQSVGPRFFATLGVPVLRGAEFSDRELFSDPAAESMLPVVINQSAARELFGDADPLGRLVRHEERIFQVAAVVADDRPAPFRNQAAATVSLPLTMQSLRQSPAQGFGVIVRARGGIDFAAIQHELEAIDGRITMFDQRTMRQNLALFEQGIRYSSAIYGVLGIFALTLACVGLAGVTSQAVVRRRKEIGIRMALGARRPQVLRLVMKEGAVMTMVGSVLGFGAGFAITRVLGSISAQATEGIALSASQPARILGAPLLLIVVAAVACYLPARRSAAMDPLVALREE